MSKVALSGNALGTGTINVAAPNTDNNYTLTLPAATTTLVGTDATQTLTNKTLTSPTIGGTPTMNTSVITSGTAVASTSGTSIDFTGIPSWVKRITVMFNAVSTSGTASFLIQLGVSGTPVTSGYVGGGMRGTSTVTGAYFTTGFGFNTSSATTLYGGSLVITNVTGNTWCATGVLGGDSSTAISIAGGSVALSGVLNMVRITTSNGTDTFDAGSINILYE